MKDLILITHDGDGCYYVNMNVYITNPHVLLSIPSSPRSTFLVFHPRKLSKERKASGENLKTLHRDIFTEVKMYNCKGPYSNTG